MQTGNGRRGQSAGERDDLPAAGSRGSGSGGTRTVPQAIWTDARGDRGRHCQAADTAVVDAEEAAAAGRDGVGWVLTSRLHERVRNSSSAAGSCQFVRLMPFRDSRRDRGF